MTEKKAPTYLDLCETCRRMFDARQGGQCRPYYLPFAPTLAKVPDIYAPLPDLLDPAFEQIRTNKWTCPRCLATGEEG